MKESIYKIYSPPSRHKDLFKLGLNELLIAPEVREALNKTDIEYLHWEDLQYKTWIPAAFSLDKELFWTFVKMERSFNSQPTPICDVKENYFQMNAKKYQEFLHIVDKEMAGNFMGIKGLSESDKRQFITRNIIEESIASSQLEGANTSRVAAKRMLLEGRRPRNHGEQMIVNNHKTMLKIERDFYKEKLSWELLCTLHLMITDQTLSSDKQGKLRETFDEEGNKLVIKPWDNKTISYEAPDKNFVEKELPKLIEFANDENNEAYGFIHPLIKAIMLHFWIGLLHPFEDGNGRLARIIFYWYMLRHDYWAFAYLSLSEKIKKSSKQYAMAYVNSEQDNCDLTYFIDYNIKILKIARLDFQKYIKSKVYENLSNASINQSKYGFNERQVKVLQYFHQKMESRTNIMVHQSLYAVKKITAISDLKYLVQNGFLEKIKEGRNVYYYPTKKISKLFKYD